MLIKKANGFVHPFVALVSAGDKVSIDFTSVWWSELLKTLLTP